MATDEAPPATTVARVAQRGSETQQLLLLIDRLEELLQRSDLAELEVQAGDTTLVLRTPAAVGAALDGAVLAALTAAGGTAASGGAAGSPGGGSAGAGGFSVPGAGTPGELDGAADQGPARHAVVAPLTGVFYASPTPEAAPYVRVGSHVQQGQVIGLIEAMKLFNEIKSDASGTVIRTVAESGTLVKAKSPLIELEPA